MTEPRSCPLLRRRVPPADAGCRLDVFLARQPEIGSRARAKWTISEGHVRVDEGRCKPGTSLAAGQLVAFRAVEPEVPVPPEPAPDIQLRILQEDATLLVIDKPPGIAVHPPEHPHGALAPNIASLALAHCGELPTIAGADRPGIVHRLDKDTSGVMLLAKTDEAFYFLQSQFKARTVRKEYRAVCHGDPRFDSDHIEGNIAVDPRSGDRMTVVREGGKEASTYYEVIERFGDLTYVRCLPKSGRTHQIRVHMASIGHPLVADRLYFNRRAPARLPDDAPAPGRHCLHAFSIRFRHPKTHEELLMDAPVPDDMTQLLRWLARRRG